jgi:hypothetical protein
MFGFEQTIIKVNENIALLAEGGGVSIGVL